MQKSMADFHFAQFCLIRTHFRSVCAHNAMKSFFIHICSEFSCARHIFLSDGPSCYLFHALATHRPPASRCVRSSWCPCGRARGTVRVRATNVYDFHGNTICLFRSRAFHASHIHLVRLVQVFERFSRLSQTGEGINAILVEQRARILMHDSSLRSTSRSGSPLSSLSPVSVFTASDYLNPVHCVHSKFD